MPTYAERRRVPGLRREELAMLAGVSASYYTRLEQGQSLGASPEVLDAIARALRLDESERQYLHELARADRYGPKKRRAPAERVSEAMEHLVDVFADVPAFVMGRRSDVLGWNRLGNALFAGHLDFEDPRIPARRPNMARLVFLDGHIRELYADWPAKARAVVGNLRIASSRFPQDTALHALIGELTSRSEEFAEMWADHRIKPCAVAAYEMRHPVVGTLSVLQQTLSHGPGPTLVVATTAPDSSSRAAVNLLAQAISRNAVAVDGGRMPASVEGPADRSS